MGNKQDDIVTYKTYFVLISEFNSSTRIIYISASIIFSDFLNNKYLIEMFKKVKVLLMEDLHLRE